MDGRAALLGEVLKGAYEYEKGKVLIEALGVRATVSVPADSL